MWMLNAVVLMSHFKPRKQKKQRFRETSVQREKETVAADLLIETALVKMSAYTFKS